MADRELPIILKSAILSWRILSMRIVFVLHDPPLALLSWRLFLQRDSRPPKKRVTLARDIEDMSKFSTGAMNTAEMTALYTMWP